MRPSITLLFLAACTPSGSPPPAPETSARSAHQAVASAAPVPVPAAAPAGACPPATQKRVTELADAYRTKSGVPGVAIAVYEAGQRCIVTSGTLREGGEKVTKDTIFSMGSVQKVFNATLLAYAIENGKAKIDDPATKYLTAANGATVPASAAFAKVTLKDLVTHTASLPGGSEDDDKEDADGWDLYRDKPVPNATIDFLKSWSPAYPIGTKYAYSNLGFVLAGYAAVDAAKTPYQKLLSTVVTEPLGMQSTAPTLCQTPSARCATGHNAKGRPDKGSVTGLFTTAEDMLAFLEANLGVRTLPDLSRRAFARTHVALFDKKGAAAIGMGWEITGKGDDVTLAKNGAGAGFSSWIGFDPKAKHGVVVLTNAQNLGDGKPPVLGHEVLSSLH